MAKKRFFTKNNERVGKKSGKPRGKYIKRAQVILVEETNVQPFPKEQSKKIKLPNIPRNIPESLSNLTFSPKTILLIAFISILGVVSLWQIIGLIEKSNDLRQVVAQRQTLNSQMQTWESVAQKYPGYRDAYFQAAVLAYRLGDRGKEKEYLGKALRIDPNYEPAKKLEFL